MPREGARVRILTPKARQYQTNQSPRNQTYANAARSPRKEKNSKASRSPAANAYRESPANAARSPLKKKHSNASRKVRGPYMVWNGEYGPYREVPWVPQKKAGVSQKQAEKNRIKHASISASLPHFEPNLRKSVMNELNSASASQLEQNAIKNRKIAKNANALFARNRANATARLARNRANAIARLAHTNS